MTTKLLHFKSIAILTFLLSTASAIAGGSAEQTKKNMLSTDEMASKLEQIHSSIGSIIEKGTCETDAHCSVLPIGQKPCGGPSSYMPYSLQLEQSNLDKLKVLASDSKKLARKINEQNQMMSNCQYEPKPEALCTNRRCELEQRDTNGLKVQ